MSGFHAWWSGRKLGAIFTVEDYQGDVLVNFVVHYQGTGYAYRYWMRILPKLWLKYLQLTTKPFRYRCFPPVELRWFLRGEDT